MNNVRIISCRGDPYPELTLVETAIAVSQPVKPVRLTPPSGMSPEMKQLFSSMFQTNAADRPNFTQVMKQLDNFKTLFSKDFKGGSSDAFGKQVHQNGLSRDSRNENPTYEE